MSTAPENQPKRSLSIKDIGVPWFLAWLGIVALSSFIGYQTGFKFGEERGWSAGVNHVVESLNAYVKEREAAEPQPTTPVDPAKQVIQPEGDR